MRQMCSVPLGSQKLASLGSHLLNGQIQRARWKNEIFPLIKEMGKAIELASICGLGRSVPIPLMTAATFFQEDLARHLSGNGAAPAGKSEQG